MVPVPDAWSAIVPAAGSLSSYASTVSLPFTRAVRCDPFTRIS